jgi:ribosomal protein L11 methyltransferase
VIRLAVRVQYEQAELVLAELLALEPAGVEETDAQDGTVEYAIYGSAGELPSLPALKAAAGGALVEVRTSETADDWQERWKQFHRAVLIGPPAASTGGARVPALEVRPSWQPPSGNSTGPLLDIGVAPGQAFGTGAHASTRLCLELLLELAGERRDPMALLDVGTGSGVVAIAAAKLGFAPVLGVDNDPASVRAARANAAVNSVHIDVRRLDMRVQPLPLAGAGANGSGARPAALVANLVRPLLLELARGLERPPAHLIAGGLLEDQTDEVARAFRERLGMCERARRGAGEWAALWLASG